MGTTYETLDFSWCVFKSLQGRGHSYNPYYLLWKPMQKQKTPRKHGITLVEYTTNPITRISIGENIPINNIKLSILFDKKNSNIVVCISFDIDTTSVLGRWLKRSFEWKLTQNESLKKNKTSLELSTQP